MLVDGLGSLGPRVVLFTPLSGWVCCTQGGWLTGLPGAEGTVAGGGPTLAVAPQVVGTASRTSVDEALAAIFSTQSAQSATPARSKPDADSPSSLAKFKSGDSGW